MEGPMEDEEEWCNTCTGSNIHHRLHHSPQWSNPNDVTIVDRVLRRSGRSRQTTTSSTKATTTRKKQQETCSWWEQYQRYVHKNQSFIYLYDEILSRFLLLWTPPPPQEHPRLGEHDTNHYNENYDTSSVSSSSSSSSSSSLFKQWREVVLRCLELHRLVVQIAIQSMNTHGLRSLQAQNVFGTSVALAADNDNRNDKNKDKKPTMLSTIQLRLGLTIVQALYPILPEMIRLLIPFYRGNSSSSHHPQQQQQYRMAVLHVRQVQVRRCMEWIRVLLRVTILLRYWKRLYQLYRNRQDGTTTATIASNCDKTTTTTNVAVLPGLLLHGGTLYRCSTHHEVQYDTTNENNHPHRVLTYEQERQRVQQNFLLQQQQQRQMKGRSTYRNENVSSSSSSSIRSSSSKSSTATTTRTLRHLLRIVVGELLYIIRPLIQVESEHRRAVQQQHCTGIGTTNQSNLYDALKSWIFCFGLDIVSLWCLQTKTTTKIQDTYQTGQQQQQSYYNNTPQRNMATVCEWKRRRIRLWLYLLRSPIWEKYTEGSIQRIADLVYYFPLLGGYMRNSIWDTIYYWKHYRAEEG
jgi:Peroxisomal membrane protein (Pex16)